MQLEKQLPKPANSSGAAAHPQPLASAFANFGLDLAARLSALSRRFFAVPLIFTTALFDEPAEFRVLADVRTAERSGKVMAQAIIRIKFVSLLFLHITEFSFRVWGQLIESPNLVWDLTDC
jgi:hypothetical protein